MPPQFGEIYRITKENDREHMLAVVFYISRTYTQTTTRATRGT